MKKYIALLLLNIVALLDLNAQSILQLQCDESLQLDTAGLKEVVQHRIDNPEKINFFKISPLRIEEVDSVEVIRCMRVYPDTISNRILWEIKEDRLLLSFPTREYFYSWKVNIINPNEMFLSPIDKMRTQAFYLATLLAAESKDATCKFSVSLFPEDEYMYKFLAVKKSSSDDIFFVEANLNSMGVYESLESLLDVHFGSSQGYIDAYKNRIQWKSKKRELVDSFLGKY